MRHVLAALFLPFLLMMVLLCPARALAATGEQELELASSLVAMASYSDELSLLAREWLTETGWQALVKAAPSHVRSVREHLVDKLGHDQMIELGSLCAKLFDDDVAL